MDSRILIHNYKYPSIIVMLFTLLTACTSAEKTVDEDKFRADILAAWNQKVIEMAIAEDNLLTLKGVRTEAMMHVAIHDVLNAIKPAYEAYSFEEVAITANPLAAVAQTAYEVASNQYPENQKELEDELNKWLNTVEQGKSKQSGIKIGKLAADKIIQERSKDNYNGQADYTWHPMAPGVYAEFNEHSGTPEGFIFGAGWATARPFLLEKPDQFRSPPPPAINSEDYTVAFEEVKSFGSLDSKTRSMDQAHLAMWWKDFVENSHNKLARELVTKENLNLWEAARVFALLNMTIYDAYINVFDNKFYYNHWRPFTAIRWAENDENPATTADPAWTNLHNHTYPFPSYPSAHGTASSAAMKVLANTLGSGDNYKFTMTTDSVDRSGPFSGKIYMDPPTRSFESFSSAGLEAAMSRVYLGIHFRYDSEEGYRLGNTIGSFASTQFLNPKKPK